MYQIKYLLHGVVSKNGKPLQVTVQAMVDEQINKASRAYDWDILIAVDDMIIFDQKYGYKVKTVHKDTSDFQVR